MQQRAAGRRCGRHFKYDVISEIRLRQSMHIYLKNNPAKFHPVPIWNDGTLGSSDQRRPNKKNNKSTIWVTIWDKFLIHRWCGFGSSTVIGKALLFSISVKIFTKTTMPAFDEIRPGVFSFPQCMYESMEECICIHALDFTRFLDICLLLLTFSLIANAIKWEY